MSEGSGALALFPGETLGEESSTGVMSKGFAYQGIYHKKTFVAEKGSGYVISADVYPKGAEVKARLLVMDGSRAIAASQAFEVDADGWEKIAFRWQPTQTVSKARIRVVFYQITEGKKIVIDALNCEEQFPIRHQVFIAKLHGRRLPLVQTMRWWELPPPRRIPHISRW